MRLIDADDLYQKCIDIQLKKRNRYFDIDDVIKLIKKAPTIDILDKIRAEIAELQKEYKEYGWAYDDALEVIDKYRKEVDE